MDTLVAKIHALPVWLAFSFFLVAGCASASGEQVVDSAEDVQSAPLAGSAWRLLSFGTAAGSDVPAVNGKRAATLSFSASEGRLSGTSGCNRYFARYTSGAEQLSISQTGATKRACPPPLMAQERVFFEALGAATRYDRTGGALVLANAAGEPLLRFAHVGEAAGEATSSDADSSSALAGSDWRLVRVETDGGLALKSGATYSLAFHDNGRFGGRADCNSYGGRYDVEPGGALTLVRAAATQAACKPPFDMFMDVLRQVNRYAVQGDELRLDTPSNAALVFRRAESSGADAESGASQQRPEGGAGPSAEFRAVGQEPGWLLEITEGERIRFAYDYATREVAAPAPAPERCGRRTVYRARTEARGLTVTITDAPCRDAMSGRRFPQTVRVRLGDESFEGCGEPVQ